MSGGFCFVLHSHIPYVRHAGVWPFGEEWLLEAMLETYVPLAGMLRRLRAEAVPYQICVGITPVLLEQIADPSCADRFEAYSRTRIERARADAVRLAGRDPARERLAGFYESHYRRHLEMFQTELRRDLIGALRDLQDSGQVEIITSAATHAYLPLLDRDSTVYAELKIGCQVYERAFGRRPAGIWLPECAYRPARRVQVSASESYVRPALDEFLARLGLRYFFCDSHAIEGGDAFGGKLASLYGEIAPPVVDRSRPLADRTTLRPYLLSSGVAVFARHRKTGLQVWSADWGYPGDGNYREFHKRDEVSGLQYWRITSRKTDLGAKEIYRPEATEARLQENSDHFAGLVREDLAACTCRPGFLVAPYDTELFGHWWFEGIRWLELVLRKIAAGPVQALSPGEHLRRNPPDAVVDLPESSWGQGGGHWVWKNPQTEWMWPVIHAAERRMEQLVERVRAPDRLQERLLRQAARELLLLVSSDWPFLITTGQAAAYAKERFDIHRRRFERLAALAERPEPRAESVLLECEERDRIFPDLDWRLFSARNPTVPAAA